MFNKDAKKVILSKKRQEDLISRILDTIKEGGYKGMIIFCGNFLLGINDKGEPIACIPELYEDENGNILDQENMNICQQMDSENFDTRFSYFSLKVGLKIYEKLNMDKQLLLSADDKYINQASRLKYFKHGFKSIPQLFIKKMETYFGSKDIIKKHLQNIVDKIVDNSDGRINNVILSEHFLVKRYKARQQRRTDFTAYNDYYHSLGSKFSSCSLEIFHLLTVINEQKTEIFKNLNKSDKIGLLMFVPDACTSSAMQGGLAVSKTNENFEIINVTQTSTVQEGTMMITRISKGGVERI